MSREIVQLPVMPAKGRSRTEARSGNVIASPTNAIDLVGTVVPGSAPS